MKSRGGFPSSSPPAVIITDYSYNMPCSDLGIYMGNIVIYWKMWSEPCIASITIFTSNCRSTLACETDMHTSQVEVNSQLQPVMFATTELKKWTSQAMYAMQYSKNIHTVTFLVLAEHFFLGKKLHSLYTCHVANTFLLITDNIWHFIISIVIITSAVLTMHTILFISISVYTARWKWEGKVCITYATSFLWVTRYFVEKYVWMKEIFEQLVWKTHDLKCLLAKDKKSEEKFCVDYFQNIASVIGILLSEYIFFLQWTNHSCLNLKAK